MSNPIRSARVLVMLLCGLVPLSSTSAAQTAEPQTAAAAARQRRAAEEARRQKGLQAAAALVGNYEGTQGFLSTIGVHESAEALMADSDATLVGVVTRLRPQLSQDGKDIFTLATVRVTELVSGAVGDGDITVALPGGRVTFEDGTSATTSTPGMTMLRPGEKGLFFLKAVPANEIVQGGHVVWRPANGLEGYYGVHADTGKVTRGSAVASPVAMEIEGKAATAVVERLMASSWRKLH